VPGELEYDNERQALEHGLALEPVIWTHLEAVARGLRIPLDIAYSAR
jgi:hypothetical protein